MRNSWSDKLPDKTFSKPLWQKSYYKPLWEKSVSKTVEIDKSDKKGMALALLFMGGVLIFMLNIWLLILFPEDKWVFIKIAVIALAVAGLCISSLLKRGKSKESDKPESCDAGDINCEYSHDYEQRIEQLDSFLKNGIIDKEEYIKLKEKYLRAEQEHGDY